MSLHDEDLAEAPSRIQENVWTRHVLPGLAGAEPTPKIMGYSERGDKKIHTCRREGGEDPSCFWKIDGIPNAQHMFRIKHIPHNKTVQL
jgi:hypothetical protein